MKAIEVKQLTKRFGTFTAVDHISFEVEPGEIFGFLGANGAGKTTAMRMLCGLSVPTSGEARVAGFDVYRESESIKRNIGYMSQKFSLYGDLKVWENIRLFGGIYGLSKRQLSQKTDELLDILGLEKERNTLVDSLPLGWKQKLSFSVAIIHDPKIVFLDDPTFDICDNPHLRKTEWMDKGIDPMGLHIGMRKVYNRYRLPMIVTENGMAYSETLGPDGQIHDPYRIEYLKEHIEQIGIMIDEGLPVFGYCPWSFVDVVSSHQGFAKRYGLVYVDRTETDPKQCARVKKDSFYWYQKVITNNGLTE